MRVPTTCLLLCALALPAYAGQGSIVETDDEIIVEYTGDVSDKPADRPADRIAERPATPPAGAPASGAAAPPAGNPATGAAAGDAGSGRSATTVATPPPRAGTERPPRMGSSNRRDRSSRPSRSGLSGDANGASDANSDE